MTKDGCICFENAHGKIGDCPVHDVRKAPSALEVAEKRFESYGLTSLNSTDLLLLDIARSLRESNKIAREGLEWSKSLASLFETKQ